MRRFRTTGVCLALGWVVASWTAAPPLRAQRPASSPFSDVTRSAWYNVNGLLLAAAKRMPREHYTFRPAKNVRSFGEIVGHLTAEHYAMCGAVSGRPAPKTNFEKLTSKEELVNALQESSAVCDLAYGLLTDENAGFHYTIYNIVATRLALLTDNVTHDNEHYGNLATYMRMKGVTPPSTGQ